MKGPEDGSLGALVLGVTLFTLGSVAVAVGVVVGVSASLALDLTLRVLHPR